MFTGVLNWCILCTLITLFLFAKIPASGATLSDADELSFNSEATVFGIYGTSNAKLISFIGARASRTLLWDTKITPEKMPGILNALEQKREQGLDQIIVTIRWPYDDGDNSFFDRIPEDYEAELQELDVFLAATEGLIDWIQIQNEPVGGPGNYGAEGTPLLTLEEAFDWWVAVALRIKAYNTANNTNIGIISPALTGFGLVIDDGYARIQAIHEAMVDFANTYCDALDMHLHTTDLAQLETILDYVDTLEPQPTVAKVALEWSQAKAVRDYVNEPDNVTFLDSIYAGTPVSVEEWQGFVKAAPIDNTFIVNAMRLLQQRGFLIACYGSVLQFSKTSKDRHFDLTAVYAQRTTGSIHPNQPIFDQLRALSAAQQLKAQSLKVTGIDSGAGDSTLVSLKFPVLPASIYQLYYSQGGLGSWASLGDSFTSVSEVDAEITAIFSSSIATPTFFKLRVVNPARNLP